MEEALERFADPLKDYGYDPRVGAQGQHVYAEDLPLELFSRFITLNGGLNLLPADPFDGRSTPGSCVSRRPLDWLHDLSPGRHSANDIYEDVHPEALFDGAPLESRLQVFMYGHDEGTSKDDERFVSWDLPEMHPVKSSLRHPGHPDFAVNTNWYDRIQWAYRSALPKNKSKLSLYVLGSDEERELLLEVGRFRKACTYGGTRLLVSLLHSGIDSDPTDYFELTDDMFPYAKKFYSKKFPRDRQFVKDGIVYTVIVAGNVKDDLLSYTVAKKIYSNDQKGKQVLCDALYGMGEYGPFAFPMQCVVDFIGLRVVAEPLVPLSVSKPYSLVDELIRDCKCPSGNDVMDITQSIFSSPELSDCLVGISKYLHLSSWPIPFEASDMVEHLAPGAAANVQRCDGNLHVRQTHETLPPILEPNDSSDVIYYNRFRPELCINYNQNLRCTLRSSVIFNEEHDADMLTDAFHHMQIILEDCVPRCNSLLDSWDISQVFHSYGINIRYLGMAYEKAVYSGLKNLLATEMVARAVKHLWDVKLQAFLSGQDKIDGTVMRSLLHLINDVFGLYANSSDFWSQSIIPEISRHFNLVKLEGISYRLLPHVMLKNAIEFNLGILLPPPKEGNTYRSAIRPEDFINVDMHQLLSKHIEHSSSARAAPSYKTYRHMLNAIFPKTQVTYPTREINMYKVANKLCNKDIKNCVAELVLLTNPIDMGICKHMRSKLVGTGYPCDPACVYNAKLTCTTYQHTVTGVNLLCLYECLLQTDAIMRMKLLIYMGYEYWRHNQLDDALECAKYVIENSPPLCSKQLEARVLELQCYSMKRDEVKCKELYEELKVDAKRLEGHDGLLSLELSVILCFEAWIRQEYKQCVSYSEFAKDITIIAGLTQYEWIPVAVASILGQCYEKLGRNVEAIKTQREAVHMCNVSHLPRYTLCHLTWMFVEYLLRNDFYMEGCPLSMDLIPILEKEFGSLSVECLRCIYVSAWANHQVGCAHVIHPLAFLCNADRIVNSECAVESIKGKVILEELVNASSCHVRLRHSDNSLGLYTSLYERLCIVQKQYRGETIEMIRIVYSEEQAAQVEKLELINREAIKKVAGKENVEADEVLCNLIAECEVYHQHLLLVIKNLLSLKVLSLPSEHCMLVAQKLYNAYVNYVSRGNNGRKDIESDSNQDLMKGGDYKPVVMYGSSFERHPEKFEASVSMDEKVVPHRGHELRSIEELLLKEPRNSETHICETCHSELKGTEFTVSEWFDNIFDLIPHAKGLQEGSFLMGLDILRHFLTPSKRLIILSHVANISKLEIDPLVTFKELRTELSRALTPQ